MPGSGLLANLTGTTGCGVRTGAGWVCPAFPLVIVGVSVGMTGRPPLSSIFFIFLSKDTGVAAGVFRATAGRAKTSLDGMRLDVSAEEVDAKLA